MTRGVKGGTTSLNRSLFFCLGLSLAENQHVKSGRWRPGNYCVGSSQLGIPGSGFPGLASACILCGLFILGQDCL